MPDGVTVAHMTLTHMVQVQILVGQPIEDLKMMKILTGTCHPELAELIAKSANVQLWQTEITRFPDNEIFVKITENVRGDDLFIVQSVSLNPNDMLMELLIMIDAAKELQLRLNYCCITLLWLC